MKIAICGLVNNDNLGEEFISASLQWLIEKNLRELGYEDEILFEEVDITARSEGPGDYKNPLEKRLKSLYEYKAAGLPLDVIDVSLKHYVRKTESIANRNRVSRFRHFIWQHGMNFKKRYMSYLDHKLNDADVIVIDGAGLLEYSWNEYQELLLFISEYAEETKKPVYVNAVGRAGEFDLRDYRCKVLIDAFRSKAVRYVSARDSLESVQACVGAKQRVKLLADAAFWVDKTYGVEAKADSDTVGIGLIRGNALQSYKKDFNEEDWIALFADIAETLQKRGYKFQFFTNGEKLDQQLGYKVLERLGLDESYITERPMDAKVLIDTIAGYKGLITCRMHSSIAAFSMRIPSVILSWNDKVDKYMAITGYPERAVAMEDFSGDYIVNAFEKALEEGISEEALQRMRDMAEESVRDYAKDMLEVTRTI